MITGSSELSPRKVGEMIFLQCVANRKVPRLMSYYEFLCKNPKLMKYCNLIAKEKNMINCFDGTSAREYILVKEYLSEIARICISDGKMPISIMLHSNQSKYRVDWFISQDEFSIFGADECNIMEIRKYVFDEWKLEERF